MTAQKTYWTKVILAFSLSLLLTLLVMAPAIATNAERVTTRQDNEPYRVESFNIDGSAKLNVKTSGGHITVEGSSTNTIRVEMFVRKDGRNLLPEEYNLEDWDIDISSSGQTVNAIAKNENNNSWNLFGKENVSISFVVYTPTEVSTDLKTSGGHIETRGLSGNQQLATSGGHLELSNLKGTIEARTSGGHIEISDVQGTVEARTSGGHIDATNTEGELNVKTSGGHIDLANVSGSVKASTSGGSIKADLPSISKLVELRTSGGNISIRVPENTGLNLNLQGSYVSTNLTNFSGEIERDEVTGKLNGGGPTLSAKTSGGTVSLDFQ